MNNSFDRILDECIARLERTGEEIETVIAAYPEHADELRRHLQVWARLRKSERAQAPAEGATAGQSRLLAELAAEREKAIASSRREVVPTGGGSMMRFLLPFAGGAAAALVAVFAISAMDSGSDSGVLADTDFQECVEEFDLNGDGVVDVEDLLLLRDAIVGGEHPPELDLNGDGVVDVFDAAKWALGIAGCLYDFGEGEPDFPGTLPDED
jgi:hypothetical protein